MCDPFRLVVSLVIWKQFDKKRKYQNRYKDHGLASATHAHCVGAEGCERIPVYSKCVKCILAFYIGVKKNTKIDTSTSTYVALTKSPTSTCVDGHVFAPRV